MADTVLGYEVASPEQMRRTAIMLLIGTVAAAIIGVFVLFIVSRWEAAGREQALATINSFDEKCRYVVRNIGRRASYYDHTGYVDCDSARQVAASNNNPLGSVQQKTHAKIAFKTKTGTEIASYVILSSKKPRAVGQVVEILYRVDNPHDVKEYVKLPFFGKKSIAKRDAGAHAAVTPRKPRPSDKLSKSTKIWIGLTTLAVLMALAYWLITRTYRLVKWLIFGPSKATPAQQAAPAPAARLRSSGAKRKPLSAGSAAPSPAGARLARVAAGKPAGLRPRRA